MKTFLKILNTIFVVLGVIFSIIIVAALYIIIADPFNLKPLWTAVVPKSSDSTEVMVGGGIIDTDGAVDAPGTVAPPVDKNPTLTAEQEKSLEAIGVDPATLPSEITPEMETCLIQAVGQDRANQIIGGEAPTPIDFFKARACL